MRPRAVLPILALLLAACSAGEVRPTRIVEAEYRCDVGAVPAGARVLDLWIPLPSEGPHQEIGALAVACPVFHEVTTEPVHGNRMVHVRAEPALPVSVSIRFRATRREARAGEPRDGPEPPASLLAPCRLGPLDDVVRDIAASACDGCAPGEAGRRLYDTVLARMRYDKSGEGWGRGDVRRACEKGFGNCTDFHALFVALCQARGIPARFEIGFPLPEDKALGEAKGYHCWAEFLDPARGWVPVDLSEADKDPSKAGYFFGRHCENRIAFTRGRDLVLAPPQQGEPQNFFIYPYAEADGSPLPAPGWSFRFRNAR